MRWPSRREWLNQWLSWAFWTEDGFRPKRRKHSDRLAFLALEKRLAPAVTVSIVGNVVNFTGDAANNSLVLSSTADGILQHNLPATGNLVRAIDLDSNQSGVQSRFVTSGFTIQATFGSGNDFFDGSALGIAYTIYGGAGSDTLTGGSANDLIEGRDGNDTIEGGDGNDTLYGDGDFNSTTSGDDLLQGGRGNDFLAADGYNSIQKGNDTLVGNEGNDSLNGYGGADQFFGGDGFDSLMVTVHLP